MPEFAHVCRRYSQSPTESLPCGKMFSSVCRLLKLICADNPDVTELALWSDACVAQNRNCVMSMAIMSFLQQQTTVEQVVQKFGTPGRHSSVQEVDALHSQIERVLDVSEIFSPVSLMCDCAS